mgnify:CR=1 FL=1
MFQLDLTLRFGHSAPSATYVGSCWYDLNKEWQGLVQRNLVPHFVKNMLLDLTTARIHLAELGHTLKLFNRPPHPHTRTNHLVTLYGLGRP